METGVQGTKTQVDQWSLEQKVGQIYAFFFDLPPRPQSIHLEVRRDQHLEYLTNSLRKLGPSFSVLDANRPWLCYWIIHSIAVLGDSVDEDLQNNTIDFLGRCQDPEGGYGGGPGQMPHLATTYAAVNTLITLGGDKSLSSINRKHLYAFFMRMKDTSGGFRGQNGTFDLCKSNVELKFNFLEVECVCGDRKYIRCGAISPYKSVFLLRMHDGGEIDVRASYTAISVASVLNILDDQLVQNVGNYIVSCQTYEGGIAGEPHSEAHGGYTFCGLAAMILINEAHRLDLVRLIDWVVFKQGVEGGFKGRTNKLVDGCYSFWQGAVAVMMQRLGSAVNGQLGLSKDSDGRSESDVDSALSDISDFEEHLDETSQDVGQVSASCAANLSEIGYDFISRKGGTKPIFSSMHLQQYILLCSQVEGGFRDKPGKSRDYYHTCYCLSGLAICQYSRVADDDSPPLDAHVLGSYSNLLEPLHSLYGIVMNRYREAHLFFFHF